MARPKKTETAVAAEKKPAKKTAVKKCATKKVAKKSCKCASKAKVTRIIAKFDAGWGNQLFIRGLGGSLDWEKGVPMQNVGGDEWLWEQLVSCDSVAFKLLLNDQVWADGEDVTVISGDTVICRPSFQ